LFIEVIRRETGRYLYPHLTRHFGAALYLRENPGAFEVVRRVLGHKSLTTTTRSYASFDDEAAVRMFDALVLRIREEIRKGVTDD
jgi:integrase